MKKAFHSDVDAPRLGGEPEAHVERDRLRADLQHRGQCARILRRLNSKGREVLRGQLEGPSPLEWREGSESWDPNDGRIAKLRMGGREPRQSSIRGAEGGERLEPLASRKETLEDPHLDFPRQ